MSKLLSLNFLVKIKMPVLQGRSGDQTCVIGRLRERVDGKPTGRAMTVGVRRLRVFAGQPSGSYCC